MLASRFLQHALRIAVLALALPATARTAPAPAPALDYSTAPFRMERILDWGERPDWSADGKRIAFTESDVRNTPAYEIALSSKKVRCLTCHLGDRQAVTRIYYLPDNSFLVLAPKRRDAGGASPAGQELYWMSAALGPLVALDAPAFGEIAISQHPERTGAVKIAWGDAGGGGSLLHMATLFGSGSERRLRDRRVIYDVRAPGNPPSMTVAEAYGFARNDTAVTFYTIFERNGTLDDEMVSVDLASGKIASLYRDPAHTETHLFADERYGLEESNRASDPDGFWRGISSHPASFMGFMAKRVKMPLPSKDSLENYAPHGRLKGFDRPFDLYVVRLDGAAPPRRLTEISELGATAHQSVIARNGRIAFAIAPRSSPELAGKGGLYVGTFAKPR
jgi:hypothetical protein